MPLKSVVDNLDGVDAAIKPLYEKGQDNKFYLQVEGMVASDRLVEFRNNNIELKKTLEKFDGIDPVKYQDLLKKETALNDKKLIDAGQVDQVVAQRLQAMKTEYEGKLTEATTVAQNLNQRLSGVLIDSAVKSAAVAAGVLPTAVDDVVLRSKTVFQVKDGEVVAMDPKGNVVYGKDPTKPLGIEEWVTGLKTNASHLFEGMRGSGARGNGGGNGTVDTSKMTATQKIAVGMAQRQGG